MKNFLLDYVFDLGLASPLFGPGMASPLVGPGMAGAPKLYKKGWCPLAVQKRPGPLSGTKNALNSQPKSLLCNTSKYQPGGRGATERKSHDLVNQ